MTLLIQLVQTNIVGSASVPTSIEYQASSIFLLDAVRWRPIAGYWLLVAFYKKAQGSRRMSYKG